MEKVFELSANYKIIKVSEDLLPSIYCELKKIPIVGNFQKIREKIENKDEKVLSFLSKKLINYKGNYARFVKIQEGHNLVPLVFRSELAKQIATWASSATFEAKYLALWTDATLVSSSDLKLWNEVLRGEFTKKDFVNNTAYLDKFFWSTEVWGLILKEIGVFIDWSATVDSGVLLSHININETISATETLTINVSITINSAT